MILQSEGMDGGIWGQKGLNCLIAGYIEMSLSCVSDRPGVLASITGRGGLDETTKESVLTEKRRGLAVEP